MFTVFVAADLYNRKVNLETTFEQLPTISTLKKKIFDTFHNECAERKPLHRPLQHFSMLSINLYDEIHQTWVELLSASQIENRSQLYVFQNDPSYLESREQIPVPVKPSSSLISIIIPAASSNTTSTTPRWEVLEKRGATTITPSSGGPGFFSDMINKEGFNTGGNHNNTTVLNSSIAPLGGDQQQHLPHRRSSSSALEYVHSHQAASKNMSHTSMVAGGPVISSLEGFDSSPHKKSKSLFPQQHYSRTEPGKNVDNMPLSEKIHHVFESMDRQRRQFVDESNFRSCLRDVRIDFAAPVIGNLFRRGDVDKDSVLSFAEFSELMKQYPTLLDSIFYRHWDLAEGEELQRHLANAMVALDDDKKKRCHGAQQVQELAQQFEEAQRLVKKIEDEKAARGQRELDLRDMVKEIDAAMDRTKRAAADKQREANIFVLKEDTAKKALADAEQESSYTLLQVDALKEHVEASERRTVELQQQWEVSKKEADNHRRNLIDCQKVVEDCKTNERQCAQQLDDAKRQVEAQRQSMQGLLSELYESEERQRHVMASLIQERDENVRLVEYIGDAQRAVEAAKDREGALRNELRLVDGRVQDGERRIQLAEQDIQHFAHRTSSTEQKEKPLIEQELRLKEERGKLEEKESTLRRHANAVFDPTSRGSPLRPQPRGTTVAVVSQQLRPPTVLLAKTLEFSPAPAPTPPGRSAAVPMGYYFPK